MQRAKDCVQWRAVDAFPKVLPLASSRLPAVCSRVTGREPLDGFSLNLILLSLSGLVGTFQFGLKSINNSGHITVIPACVSARGVTVRITHLGIPAWGSPVLHNRVVECPGKR
jgi:hypothetical protein